MDDIDPNTRRIMEGLQSRSKKYGISDMSKMPLTESNVRSTPARQQSTKSRTVSASPRRRASTDRKQSSVTSPSVKNRAVALRTVNNTSVSETKNALNIDAKENVDVALEINITTGPNVQVQVEVEEQELDGDGKVLNRIQKQRKQITTTEGNHEVGNGAPSSYIRDPSRNQLHRLGTLYSNPQDLSSPVHRTETAFTIEEENEPRSGMKLKKSNKLAELANSYNEWEDDTHTKGRAPKPGTSEHQTVNASKTNDSKIISGIKSISKSPRKFGEKGNIGSITNRMESIEMKETDDNKNSRDKKLKWDKGLMDSLQSQGFTRRDTTHKRLEYNFNEQTDGKETNTNVSNVSKPLSGIKAPVSKGAIPKENGAKQEPTKKIDISKGVVSSRAALFETNATRDTNIGATAAKTAAAPKNQKDPAEMSVKERWAFFEKNKCEALIPKAALGMAPSIKQIMADKKPSENVKQVITTPQQPSVSSSTVTSVAPTASKINNFNKAVKADSNATGSGVRQTVAALLSAPPTISESRIANEFRQIREKEMNVVLNRFNNRVEEPAAPPPAPPMPKNLYQSNSAGRKRRSNEKLGVSADVRRSIEDIKRIRVKPAKSGHVYPTLSDIESSGAERNTPEIYTPEPAYTDDDNEQPILDRYMCSSQDEQDEEEDSYMDSEDEESNVSDRRANVRHVHYADSSITSTNTDGSDFDKYIDEAIDNVDDEDMADIIRKGNTMPKSSISSNSFSYERKPLNRYQETIFEDEATTSNQTSKYQSPIKSQLTVNPSDDNNSVTLTHTVSFYRRQQNQNSPSVQKTIRSQPTYESAATDDTTEYDDEDEKYSHENKYIRIQEDEVEHKIKSLMNNIMIQNQHIAQASNALNTCASTFEFSGSMESAVAEWKLLVATHSRKAALQEVQRLKVEGCLRPADAPRECGRITIKDIVLPLREDYMKKVREEKIIGHNLVCLLKYNEHVLATKHLPTLPGLMAIKFPGELHFDNVYADFKITLEIYGMIRQHETVPHDIKYHLNSKKKGVMKTPKGKKGGTNLIMPPAQSPAGPNAVRAPAFAYYGFIIFSLREVQRNTWTLNQVSASDITPLVGTVHMKINCALSVNIDHKAFLTMFEDVSGFGAWHRRWCRLHGNILSYWKYPDDEQSKQPPIGSLDLSACVQHNISTAPREVCARHNTLMIELKRPRRDDDEDSMLLQTQGEYSLVRHLLSADTKEDREIWCEYFNKTLALMRAWGNSDRQSK